MDCVFFVIFRMGFPKDILLDGARSRAFDTSTDLTYTASLGINWDDFFQPRVCHREQPPQHTTVPACKLDKPTPRAYPRKLRHGTATNPMGKRWPPSPGGVVRNG